jgi:minor histocompatibility antigen H13
MVDVATKLDVPIKLMWPKALAMTSDQGFTMLGLGDIQVPGMFISLCLRYDYFRFSQSQVEHKESKAQTFAKPYFYACVVAYVVGLVTTVSVMHLYHAAQPALLYLRLVEITFNHHFHS